MKWIAAIAVVLVLVLLGIFLAQQRPEQPRTFDQQLLHEADSTSAANRIRASLADDAAPLLGSPELIRPLVRAFVLAGEEDELTALEALHNIGSEAHPHAMEMLRDPTLRKALSTVDEENYEAPFDRLCELLLDDPPPDLIEAIRPFYDAKEPEVRRACASLLGEIGGTETLSDFKRLLADEDEYVRSSTLYGIRDAFEDGRIEEAEKDMFFELVSALWPTGDDDQVPWVLHKLDPELARERLLRDDVFHAEFDGVHETLDMVRHHGETVAREKLLKLLDEAEPKISEFPKDVIVGEALPLLGAYRNEADLDRLKRHLASSERRVVDGAIDGLKLHLGIGTEFREAGAVKWESMTEPERHLVMAFHLDSRVRNGGFASFFMSTAGNDWPIALKGLKEMGATKQHAAFDAVLQKFPQGGPDRDLRRRMEQLPDFDVFKPEESIWYNEANTIEFKRRQFEYDLDNLEGREISP